MNTSRFVAAGCLTLAFTGAAQANNLYNNINAAPLGGAFVEGDGSPLGASFTSSPAFVIGSPTPITSFANDLSSVELKLQVSNADPNAGILVTVWDDVGNSPANEIGSLGGTSDAAIAAATGGSGWATMTFTPTTGIIPLLNSDCSGGAGNGNCGDTRFWIQIDDANPTVSPSSAIWALAGDGSYPNEWSYFGNNDPEGNGGFYQNNDINGPYTASLEMCVQALGGEAFNIGQGSPVKSSCAVPEPASLGLLGVALAGLGLLRLRRRA